MIISPASRRRATRPGGWRPALSPVPAHFRLEGGLPCAAAAGIASAASAIREPLAPALVASEARPIVVSLAASAERPILERFFDDLSVAPELAGELVALYVEQHPHLTLRFVAAAIRANAGAGAAILQAARQREAGGLPGLALVLLAAMALVAPAEMERETPPVIVDIGPWPLDGDFPW